MKIVLSCAHTINEWIFVRWQTLINNRVELAINELQSSIHVVNSVWANRTKLLIMRKWIRQPWKTVHQGIHILLRRNIHGIRRPSIQRLRFCSHLLLRNNQVKIIHRKEATLWCHVSLFYIYLHQFDLPMSTFFLIQVQVVHVHTQPIVGPTPTMVVCLNCHRNVLTRLEYEATMRTHLMALTCCIFG